MLDCALTMQCKAYDEHGPALAVHQPQALPSCSPFTSQWRRHCSWQAMRLKLIGACFPVSSSRHDWREPAAFSICPQ